MGMFQYRFDIRSRYRYITEYHFQDVIEKAKPIASIENICVAKERYQCTDIKEHQ